MERKKLVNDRSDAIWLTRLNRCARLGPSERLPYLPPAHAAVRKLQRCLSVVCDWFSIDPSACVNNRRAQQILRKYHNSGRPWIRYPSAEEIAAAKKPAEKEVLQKQLQKAVTDAIARQHIPWCEDLRNEILRLGVPRALAERFADLLTVYWVIGEGEEVRSKEPVLPLAGARESKRWRKERQAAPEWRRAKRLLQRLGSDLNGTLPLSPSIRPPHREALKSTISRLMIEDLQSGRLSNSEAAEVTTSIWELIDEADSDSDPASLARSANRSKMRKRR